MPEPPVTQSLLDQVREIQAFAQRLEKEPKTAREAQHLLDALGDLLAQAREVSARYKALLWADSQPNEEAKTTPGQMELMR